MPELTESSSDVVAETPNGSVTGETVTVPIEETAAAVPDDNTDVEDDAGSGEATAVATGAVDGSEGPVLEVAPVDDTDELLGTSPPVAPAARRRLRFRRTKDEKRAAPLVSSDDLDRIVADLHKLGSRFSQPSPHEARLATRISIAARELSILAGDRKARAEPWARAATGLIADARQALESHQIVDGWQLLRAAERHLVDGRTADELEDQLVLTRKRLGELAPIAVADLPSPHSGDITALRSAVRRIRGLLDAYLDEFDRVTHQRARMLGQVSLLLLGVLVMAGVAVSTGLPGDEAGSVLSSFGGFMTIAGLGVAGAVISRALRGERNDGARIVEATNPLLVHLFRLGIGGASALVVAVVLQSDLQGLISAAGASVYPFAIAAGFAERFADRVYAQTEEGCAEFAAGSLGVEDI